MDKVEEQFAAFNDVDWSAFPGPTFESKGRVVEMYDPKEVPRALRMLSEVTNEAEAKRAESRVLFAIGNNHAGSLYPAAVAAMPFVVAIARQTDRVWASSAALNMLIDIVASFAPDRKEYEVFVRPDGTAVGLMDAVFEPLRQVEHEFRVLLADESLPQQLRDLLSELIELLEYRVDEAAWQADFCAMLLEEARVLRLRAQS